ncbi:hypothetical protein D9M68_19580 [compost metagenome]
MDIDSNIFAKPINALYDIDAPKTESRSATKAFLFKHRRLDDTEYVRRGLSTLLKALGFNDDPVNNRRRYNNASRKTKTAICRRQRKLDSFEGLSND